MHSGRDLVGLYGLATDSRGRFLCHIRLRLNDRTDYPLYLNNDLLRDQRENSRDVLRKSFQSELVEGWRLNVDGEYDRSCDVLADPLLGTQFNQSVEVLPANTQRLLRGGYW